MAYASAATWRRNLQPGLTKWTGRSHGAQIYKGRVRFHDGDVELAPGFRCTGWRATRGCRSFASARGRLIVLASDAPISTANERDRAFPSSTTFKDGGRIPAPLRSIADAPRLIVPGTDPL